MLVEEGGSRIRSDGTSQAGKGMRIRTDSAGMSMSWSGVRISTARTLDLLGAVAGIWGLATNTYKAAGGSCPSRGAGAFLDPRI